MVTLDTLNLLLSIDEGQLLDDIILTLLGSSTGRFVIGTVSSAEENLNETGAADETATGTGAASGESTSLAYA
ncbi:MAG: hypothetical protein ACR5LG_10825 [Sodalis sp. (in: enterobacteria)]|uniref:hypothetical protein n=1 Tax=Sodalis sp. (in: enterobacteria) TaxID=1898979 RepID=UPI003F360A4E